MARRRRRRGIPCPFRPRGMKSPLLPNRFQTASGRTASSDSCGVFTPFLAALHMHAALQPRPPPDFRALLIRQYLLGKSFSGYSEGNRRIDLLKGCCRNNNLKHPWGKISASHLNLTVSRSPPARRPLRTQGPPALSGTKPPRCDPAVGE